MKILRNIFAVAVLALCFAPPAHARLMSFMTFQERFDKSDLVVIARPTTATKDTAEKTYFDNDIVNVTANGERHKVAAVGVETDFRVLYVVKGDIPLKQLVLHHLRETSSQIVPGGPGVMSFTTEPEDFLMFLVKEMDGRYTPYGGQTDPASYAIFKLEGAIDGTVN